MANAQAGSHGPVHALLQGVSNSLELHTRNSHDSVCPKPSKKHSEGGWCTTTPVDDTDVDQCPVAYAAVVNVGFLVSRLYTQYWKCFEMVFPQTYVT